ncbi:MAG: hypothetical protein ACD_46C00611G0002 [uncultured bacterium]|nr:MAG: hypothetical protein ACD_46C00611G0002 [uncultured bacterium]
MYQNRNGFSLIEALMVVALSVLMTATVLEIYLSSVRAFHYIELIARISQRASSTLEILSGEIKKAGYIGCARLSPDLQVRPLENDTLTIANRISGTDNEITIRKMSQKTAFLEKTNDDLSSVTVTSNIKFSSGDMVIIADCHGAEFAEINHVSLTNGRQKLHFSSALHKNYLPGTEVGHYEIQHFFLKPSKHQSLFYEDIHKQKYAILSDVLNIHFTYFLKNNVISLVEIELNLHVGKLNKTWFSFIPVGEI